MSWPFAQVVAIHLLFLALHEWLGQKRWLVIGFLLGLTAATRLSAGLNIGLFAAAALMTERGAKKKALLSLTLGFVVPIALLALYNFARFDSVLETGYGLQPPGPGRLPVNIAGQRVAAPESVSFRTAGAVRQISVCHHSSHRHERLPAFALVMLSRIAEAGPGLFRCSGELPGCAGGSARLAFHRSVPIGLSIFVGFTTGGDLFDRAQWIPWRSRYRTRFKLLTVLGFVFTLYFFWSFIAIVPHR